MLSASRSSILQTTVTQEQMFEYVLNDALLGSSIYVNIALAGVTLLLFAYMTRGVTDPRSKLIVVSAMAVSAVSIASYTGLASGLTIGVLQMPEGHALAGATVDLPDGSTVDGPSVSGGGT